MNIIATYFTYQQKQDTIKTRRKAKGNYKHCVQRMQTQSSMQSTTHEYTPHKGKTARGHPL